MKVNPSSVTYIRWRDPQGLHEDSITCISELRFARDELKFLNDLIASHTLELLSENLYATSKELMDKIGKMRKGLKPLIKNMVKHSNNLELLLDDIDIPDEDDDYKIAHYNLMFEAVSFLSKFKKLKRRVFRLIKAILKENKKRKLLDSGK
jgi:hypothetical protein